MKPQKIGPNLYAIDVNHVNHVSVMIGYAYMNLLNSYPIAVTH